MDVNILDGSIIDRIFCYNKVDWQTFKKIQNTEDLDLIETHVSKTSLKSSTLEPYLLLEDSKCGLVILPELIPDTFVYTLNSEDWRISWKRK